MHNNSIIMVAAPPNFRGGAQKFQAKIIGVDLSKKLNLEGGAKLKGGL